MKIALISFGSRGDLEPVIALGAELIRRGHDARVVTNADVQELSLKNKVPLRLIPLNVKSLLQQKGDALLSAKSAVKSLKILSSIILDNLESLSLDVFEQAKDCDLIIINERYYVLARNFMDHNNARVVQICFQPKGATRQFPYLYYRPWYFKLMPNRFTHRFVDAMLLRKFLPAINRMRADSLRMKPLSLFALLRQKWSGLMLEGYSPTLFEQPDDWGGNLKPCGNWNNGADQDEALPADLQAFLDKASFTLFVGFGSMLYDVRALEKTLLQVAENQNISIVWAQNWNDQSGIREGLLHERIFVLNDCKHRQIFPHVDAVMHHGGSGTIHTAAAIGVPQLIAWFMLDQQFWATQIQSLGIGVNLDTFHSLTVEKMTQTIQTLRGQEQVNANCLRISERVSAENGVEYAVNCLEQKGLLATAG